MRTISMIDKFGKETSVEKESCAKFIVNNETNKTGYYIKYGDGFMYHPKLSKTEVSKIQWRFLKVSQEKFEKYIEFLTTKNEITYRKLER